MKSIRSALAALLLLGAGAGHAANCPDYSALKNAYFGDLHSHTSYSLDAYNFGTRTDPVSAYAFATGAAVNIGEGYDASGGQVPGPFGVTISFTGGKLDFLAVTDHSEWLSSDYGCTVDTASPFYGSPLCDASRNLLLPRPTPLPCRAFVDGTATGCQGEQTKAWEAERAATTSAYQPCTFTTFHAYEWTHVAGPRTNRETLHKNVFFSGETVPALPLDSLNYPTAPALWAGLAAQCLASEGCAALTIPHNSNQSMGQAFDFAGYTPTDLDLMMQFQKLVEIHQHKGNSECLTDSADSGAVTACDFEVDPADARPQDQPGYVRPGLESGITTFAASGFNPLQMGFVGATDNHDGTPGNVGESTWPGFVGAIDNRPALRLRGETRNRRNPGGVTGVWAEENTRESIWAALQRRETFATSGPRIAVRFYAYADLPAPCSDPSFPAQVVDAGAVPMGGTLPDEGSAPSFVVYAMQDQQKLAAVDIVKASVVDGAAVESVHTIALADPPYCVTWTDPAFVHANAAFYYARVKEVPTWRWSHYDCLRLRQSNPSGWQTIAPGCASSDPSNGGLDVMIQERAWASPIWYLPAAAAVPTSTPTGSAATPTASSAATHTLTSTPAVTLTPTSHPTGRPTQSPGPSSTPGPCVGDCNDDRTVTVDELVRGVNIALANLSATACSAFENQQGKVDIAQLIQGVSRALNGCGAFP